MKQLIKYFISVLIKKKKKKERNLTRQTAKRKRKITFRFGENKKLRYIVKEFATEHVSLRKGFAGKEIAYDSPY